MELKKTEQSCAASRGFHYVLYFQRLLEMAYPVKTGPTTSQKILLAPNINPPHRVQSKAPVSVWALE